MQHTVYQTTTRLCEMSLPPVVVTGFNEPTAVFDQDILIGTVLFSTANSVWLRDSAPANTLRSTEIAPDLHKVLSLLQRLKAAYTDRQISENFKSTKS